MQLTRILSFASSIAAERLRLITPALAAQYACNPAAPRNPAIEAVEMIDPPPDLRISGTACLMPRNTARSRIEKTAVPIFRAGLLERPDRAAEPCVVIDDIEGSEFLDGTIDRALDIFFAQDVGELEDCVAAVLLAVPHCPIATLTIEVGDHDRSAFAGEPDRGGASDSTRRTCNNCNLLFEFAHDFSLLALKLARSTRASIVSILALQPACQLRKQGLETDARGPIERGFVFH
jgi:hypothetical protein